MKKVNIIISITLVALTAAAWAQEPHGKDRLYAENQRHVQVMTADYRSENRVEAFANRLQHWLTPAETRGYYESPEVSMSFFFENAEVVYDRGTAVETWMTLPFENQLEEELLTLEDWMTLPFDYAASVKGSTPTASTEVPLEECLMEEVVTLENWMAYPFETALSEEPLSLENWMSNPFGELLAEEPLELERWMTHPFEIEDLCENGLWMVTTPK
jgi:hypothetical protein